jgi:hypothetical protein
LVLNSVNKNPEVNEMLFTRICPISNGANNTKGKYMPKYTFDLKKSAGNRQKEAHKSRNNALFNVISS